MTDNLPGAAQEALEAFNACPGWEQRARLLMQWGERLAPLSEAERCEANRVHGCESLVWLVAETPACCAACWPCCWPGSTA
jgi:cysteine desulfuration protein SufE